jgi:predicted MFS family arabinose efflux permease
VFGSCFVAGTAITFALGAVLVDSFGTDILFTGAAMVLIPVGVVWWLAVRDIVSTEVVRFADKDSVGPLLWLLPPSAAIGAAYVALLVWTPAYFVNVHGLTISRSGLYSAALPAIAIVATVVVGRLLGQTDGRRPALIVAMMLVASSIGLGSIPLASGLTSAFALIAVATALVSISSSLVLGLFPSMTSPKRVAFGAGIFAFAFNMGGGAGAPIIGRLLDQDRWDHTFLLLAAIVAAGAIWTGGWYSTQRP